jgi:copper chaperone
MHNFQVDDMTCAHCVGAVEKAVKGVDAQARVEIDLPTKLVRIDSAKPASLFVSAIEAAGYTGTPHA